MNHHRSFPRIPSPRIWTQRVGTERCAVHVVEFDVRQFTAAFFALADIPLPAQIQRSVPKRQCEYFHGRLAARSALAASGIHGFDVYSDAQRAPIFPPTVIGSISHTGSMAVSAVLPKRAWNGLGLDIEQCMTEDMLSHAASIALSAPEQQILRSATLPYQQAVTLAFSAKESFYKAVSRHAGRILDFSALRLRRLDSANTKLGFVVAEDISPELPRLTPLSIDYGFLDASTVWTAFIW